MKYVKKGFCSRTPSKTKIQVNKIVEKHDISIKPKYYKLEFLGEVVIQ